MKNLLVFIILTLVGVFLGSVTGIDPITTPAFDPFATIALLTGLYVSVASIELDLLGVYKRASAIVTTIGVPIQIFATAAVMYIIYPHPVSLLVAVAIDQIDPLSVASLMKSKFGMSTPAKNLLKIWSAFDDPVTVLVGFSLIVPLVSVGGSFDLIGYIGDLALNVVPVGFIFLLYKYTNIFKIRSIAWMFLIWSAIYAFAIHGFLFMALVALMIRPFDAEKAAGLVDSLYFVVIVVVGMAILHYGIDLRLGFILAVVEFFLIQPISALVLVNGTTNDIFRLAFAQQNGITTILMGLAFQSLGFNVLPILLPAIVFINFFNLTINGLYSWKEEHGKLITTQTLQNSQ